MSRDHGVVMSWQMAMGRAGHVASTRDLRRIGLSDVDVRMFVSYGLLVRVRVGWYVTPGVDAAVREAVRLGGRLACLSALRHRGAPVGDDGRLHIELPAHAVRRPGAGDPSAVKVHWTRRPSSGDRATVDIAAAWRVARTCVGTPPCR
ncbi:hypothetical protein J2Y46_002016 [Microbacterium sp. BE35]|nr:hypothetical protein [Microbacterium sp. BE35]MDR7189193.1 hypothetical protein [Microbacterium sp. BE35]